MKAKALLLMSGGLDSILAARILQNQGVDVTPICFKSYFFDCGAAKKASKQLGLKLKEVDFSKEHLSMLKAPQFGRGSAINPCIDCHLLMLKEAKKIMVKEKYDFVATGEVLGERPMSQNARSLSLLEKEAGLEGLLLRPLSAKVLDETVPEKNGLVDREKLEGISGRSRRPQLELARQFGIKEFPTPAGGCILTEKNYSTHLSKLLYFKKEPDDNDCKLIRQGRIFWEGDMFIVIARDEEECKKLKRSKRSDDVYLEPKNFTGPSVIVRALSTETKKSSLDEMISIGKKYLLQFSKTPLEDPIFTIWPSPKF
ncbi:MAG: tRNA 4-thiouridine(8) synthase ThiI [Candidatus Paceibacterota bacterium]